MSYRQSASIKRGDTVRVVESVAGLGEALDRYAEVVGISLSHRMLNVLPSAGPRAGKTSWVRIEDVTKVAR